MKIPFDIKYRPQIESGEYEVETRSGKPARIICWDRRSNEYPIVALIGETSELLMDYHSNGCYNGSDDKCDRDLFIITPDAEKDEHVWHSVDESLPPMGEEVIALTDVLHGNHLSSARYICFAHIVDKRYAVDYNGWNIDGVKYWMSCPSLDTLK